MAECSPCQRPNRLTSHAEATSAWMSRSSVEPLSLLTQEVLDTSV